MAPFDFRTGSVAPQRTLSTGLPAGWLLGVDPGASHAGACLLHGDQVVESRSWSRQEDEKLTVEGTFAWAHRVVAGVAALVKAHVPEEKALLVAVELVVPPAKFVTTGGGSVRSLPLSQRQIRWLPDTAYVAGLVTGWAQTRAQGRPLVVPVRPGGHDNHDLSVYPSVLRGRRPKGWQGTGVRSHEMAAYSIACAGAKDHLSRKNSKRAG